jgi:hypothetical protein
MKKRYLFLCVLFLSLTIKSQSDCNAAFKRDTIFIPKEQKLLEGDFIETTLKNQSVVQLFNVDNTKFYLKLYVTENFYFNKIDVLEIKSGKKSYYAKDTKQFKLSKTKGMFVIEIFKNYLATLKEEGITSIVFGGAETDFTRQDASQLKKMATCFYETIFIKK